MLNIASAAIRTTYSHTIETLPEECCGLLFSPSLEGIVTEAVRCKNIQNEMHENSPKQYPRTDEKAYCISGLELINKEEEFIEKGYYLSGIYHSHSNRQAYFSQKDKKGATLNGKPIHPKAHYLVIGVKDGKVYNRKSFIWSEEQKQFIEEEIKILDN